MTSKQRAYLKSLAMTMDPIFQIGKASLTPEVIEGIREAIDKRELIKVSVLKNCFDDPREIAEVLAERTRSQVVQVIGKKIVKISGMHCEHCVNAVTEAINKIDGASAEVSLHGKKAVVSYDRELDEALLKKTIEDAGYKVEAIK